MPFERAIEELESIIKRLEDGKVPLAESVEIYERGEALKRRCEELLKAAEARVEKITTDAGGKAEGQRAAGCEVTAVSALVIPGVTSSRSRASLGRIMIRPAIALTAE